MTGRQAKPDTRDSEYEDELLLEELYFEKLGKQFIHHLIRSGYELQVFPLLGEVLEHRLFTLKLEPPDNLDKLFFLLSSEYSLYEKEREFEARCVSDRLVKVSGVQLTEYWNALQIWSLQHASTEIIEGVGRIGDLSGQCGLVKYSNQSDRNWRKCKSFSKIQESEKLYIPQPPYSTLYNEESCLKIFRSADNFFFHRPQSYPTSGVRVAIALDVGLFNKIIISRPKPKEPSRIHPEPIPIQDRKIIQELLQKALQKDPKIKKQKPKRYITLQTCSDSVPLDILLDQLFSRFEPKGPVDLFKIKPGQYIESPRCIQCNSRLLLDDLVAIFDFYEAEEIKFFYNKYESSQLFEDQPTPDLAMLTKVVEHDLTEIAPLTKKNWELVERRAKALMEEQLKIQKTANLHIEQNNGMSKLQSDSRQIEKYYTDFLKLVKSRLVYKRQENIELLKDTCRELKRLKYLLEMKISHLEELKQ